MQWDESHASGQAGRNQLTTEMHSAQEGGRAVQVPSNLNMFVCCLDEWWIEGTILAAWQHPQPRLRVCSSITIPHSLSILEPYQG